MSVLLREPLLHFLLLGAGVFLMYGHLNPATLDENESQTIVVTRDKLLAFAQYRARAFDAATFENWINGLSEQQLQELMREYVREEALYREAKALQLDKDDYLARLRLIRKLEFTIRGFEDTAIHLTDEEVTKYYEMHQAEYFVLPQVTFTHVFFSSAAHGSARARELALTELHKINSRGMSFAEASAHGERFLYNLNYVARMPEEVASHFGVEMQRELFRLHPDDRTWRGPFQSSHGFHLVLLTRNDPGYLPTLTEVRQRVEQDARQEKLSSIVEASVDSIVSSYRTRIESVPRVAGASS